MMKLLASAFYTRIVSLFEDEDGQWWELDQGSDGQFYWWPALKADYSNLEEWAEGTRQDLNSSGAFGPEAGNWRTGKPDNPPTHAQVAAE